MTIKILVLGPPGERGGVTGYLKGILGPVRGRGFKVSFLSVGFNRVYVPLPSRVAGFFSDFIRFTQAVSAVKPDIVHINSAFDYKAFCRDAAYAVASKAFGKGIVIQYHGGLSEDFVFSSNIVFAKLARRIVSLADEVLVCSKRQKNILSKALPGKRITVFPCPVDTGSFPAKKASCEGFSVLFMGRFMASKGVYDIIEAARRVAAKDVGIRFVLAGDGPEHLKARKLADEYGLSEWVSFPGHVTGGEKLGLFSHAGVFVLPTSHPEGLPVALLEAMAAGLPVITTRMGGIPDVIDDGVNGILIEPGDVNALSEGILRLAGDCGLRDRMGEENRRRAAEYETVVVAGKLCGLYEKVAGP